MLKARVRAQPVEGQANAALERLLAKALGVKAADVRVARGGASRLKAVEIDGLGLDEVKARLGA